MGQGGDVGSGGGGDKGAWGDNSAIDQIAWRSTLKLVII